jgi:hypothetical protein
MDAETHNIPPRIKAEERLFNGDQEAKVRTPVAHHQ